MCGLQPTIRIPTTTPTPHTHAPHPYCPTLLGDQCLSTHMQGENVLVGDDAGGRSKDVHPDTAQSRRSCLRVQHVLGHDGSRHIPAIPGHTVYTTSVTPCFGWALVVGSQPSHSVGRGYPPPRKRLSGDMSLVTLGASVVLLYGAHNKLSRGPSTPRASSPPHPPPPHPMPPTGHLQDAGMPTGGEVVALCGSPGC